jgi:hypothetical protein
MATDTMPPTLMETKPISSHQHKQKGDRLCGAAPNPSRESWPIAVIVLIDEAGMVA